eukprot:gene3253-3765_t
MPAIDHPSHLSTPMAMTAMNIMSQVDMPSGPTAAESQRTGGSVALSIAAPQPSSLEGSPLSPPLHGVTDVLEPACKPAGHELVQMVSIKTGVPVLITAGERQRCYGICADDMLAPQDQFDAIKVNVCGMQPSPHLPLCILTGPSSAGHRPALN